MTKSKTWTGDEIIAEIDRRIDYYSRLAAERKLEDSEISDFYRGGANSLKILGSWLESRRLTE